MEPDCLFWQCCISNDFLTTTCQLLFWLAVKVKRDARFFQLCPWHPPLRVSCSLPRNWFFRTLQQFVSVGKCRTGPGIFHRCMFWCVCVLTTMQPRNSPILFNKSWTCFLIFLLTASAFTKSQEVSYWPNITVSVWYVFHYLNRAFLLWWSTWNCSKTSRFY